MFAKLQTIFELYKFSNKKRPNSHIGLEFGRDSWFYSGNENSRLLFIAEVQGITDGVHVAPYGGVENAGVTLGYFFQMI